MFYQKLSTLSLAFAELFIALGLVWTLWAKRNQEPYTNKYQESEVEFALKYMFGQSAKGESIILAIGFLFVSSFVMINTLFSEAMTAFTSTVHTVRTVG